jgi:transglutaminase-like putative cysteine protease
MLALAASLFSASQYISDSKQLQRVVEGALENRALGAHEKLERLSAWVYNNRGFAKNPDYFWIRFLGPTPMQVVKKGGDCADKSRLLSALLSHAEIESTLVMLYSPNYERPTHTVVETRMPELTAVADPVFNLVFPDGAGGYYGVRELRAHPERLANRLEMLREERGSHSKVSYYDTIMSGYGWPKTINWNRNRLTEAVGSVIGWFVEEPELLRRPRILEEPALFIMVASAVAGLLCMLFAAALIYHGRARGAAGGRCKQLNEKEIMHCNRLLKRHD